MMVFATKQQIQKIQILLRYLDLMNDKTEIISNFSKQRTTSTKELYMSEARKLIQVLSEYDPKERLKTAIFHLAYIGGIIYGDSDQDKMINAAKLNLFCRERGSVKKDLNQMNYLELKKVHRQFEAIAKNVTKSKDNKQADTAVKQLLEELNIIH